MGFLNSGFGVNGITDWYSFLPTFLFVAIMVILGYSLAVKEEKIRH